MATVDELNALRNARRLLGPDWNRRIQAADLLEEAGVIEAVPSLEAVALENQHSGLVKAVIRALGRIRDESAVTAVGRVLESAQDGMPAALSLALLLQALSNGSPAASQALIAQEKLPLARPSS